MMAESASTVRQTMRRGQRKFSIKLISSYILDWVLLVVFAVVGAILSNISPNKRPFSLDNPDISFPYKGDTVSVTNLVIIAAAAPVIIIAIISMIFVPGATVPPGTPKSLIYQRKLWELHSGWLGLALSLVSAWFITNGMKNMLGKPRPNMLARCQPDLTNIAQYVVGGANSQLVSADICTTTDTSLLDEGFRSFPSGHSSFAAAGFVYLSLFIASKFAISFPFLTPAGYTDASTFSAFPSRLLHYPKSASPQPCDVFPKNPNQSGGMDSELNRIALHNQAVTAVRRQAAAPPIYLLVIVLIPFFAAVYVCCSRWYDFQHHGFDILSGFFLGTVTSIFAFRFYHLPINQGAGWAWGPRSHDKAFWAGIGSFSYATDRLPMKEGQYAAADEEMALETIAPRP